MTPKVEHNLHGQKLGPKGRMTRKRIMDVTLNMLQNSSYKDLTVADVAYEADISSSTFYVYFEDIEDILFACVKDSALDSEAVLQILKEDWKLDNLRETLEKFVRTFNEVCHKHRIELRIRNLEADQGNPRFLEYRQKVTQVFLELFGEKVASLNPELENPQHIAIVIYTAMERLASVHEIGVRGATRSSRKRFDAAIVELLYNVLRK